MIFIFDDFGRFYVKKNKLGKWSIYENSPVPLQQVDESTSSEEHRRRLDDRCGGWPRTLKARFPFGASSVVAAGGKAKRESIS